MMTSQLAGKVVLLTGASSGIGKAIAQALAPHGVKLVLVARRADLLKALADELPCESLVLPFDLYRSAFIHEVVDEAVKRFGRLDILINNAGIGGTVGLITEISDDRIHQMLHLNLKVPMLLTKYAIKQFTQQGGGGTVLMLNSIAGKTAFPYWATYDATKAGLKAFTEAMTEEQRVNGTRFVSIFPGACDTDIWDALDLAQDASPDRSGMMQPAQVAEACLFALNQPPSLMVQDITLQPTQPAL